MSNMTTEQFEDLGRSLSRPSGPPSAAEVAASEDRASAVQAAIAAHNRPRTYTEVLWTCESAQLRVVGWIDDRGCGPYLTQEAAATAMDQWNSAVAADPNPIDSYLMQFDNDSDLYWVVLNSEETFYLREIVVAGERRLAYLFGDQWDWIASAR